MLAKTTKELLPEDGFALEDASDLEETATVNYVVVFNDGRVPGVGGVAEGNSASEWDIVFKEEQVVWKWYNLKDTQFQDIANPID